MKTDLTRGGTVMAVRKAHRQKSSTRDVVAQQAQVRISVELDVSQPRVWRDITIPATATLWDLHCVLTDLFGWNDSHLHEFTVPLWIQRDGLRLLADVPFGIDDGESERLPDHLITLADLIALESPALAEPRLTETDLFIARELWETPELPKRRPLSYKYDFGNSWQLTLQVEAVDVIQGLPVLAILNGERSGPIDDFGGIDMFNSFVNNKIDSAERKERLAWIKEVAPGWTPDSWDAKKVVFTDSRKRLELLFAAMRDEGIELPDPDMPISTRIEAFVKENRDDIDLIIENTFDSLGSWLGTIVNNTAYLIGHRNDEERDVRPRPWRRGPGRAPWEAIQDILNHSCPRDPQTHERLAYYVVMLPPEYSLCETQAESLDINFLVVFPGSKAVEERYKNRWDIWIPIGKVIAGTAAPAMRAAIHAALLPQLSPIERAARMFLLSTFDESHRSMLGLDDGQIVVSLVSNRGAVD